VETAQKYLIRIENLKQEFKNTFKDEDTNQIKGKEIETSKKKWCRVHKTNTHSNEECYRQKTRNSLPKDDKNKNLIVTELGKTITTIKLDGIINNLPVKCVVDTGANKNYINKELVSKLGLEPKDMKEESKVEFANGETEVIKEYVDTELKLAETPHVIYPIRLLPLAKLPVDVI
jgi:hypothetical protein